MTKPTRIAVLNSHPIQYFAPLYAHLNTTPELDVTALYLSDFSIRGGKDAGFGREGEVGCRSARGISFEVSWQGGAQARSRRLLVAHRSGDLE